MKNKKKIIITVILISIIIILSIWLCILIFTNSNSVSDDYTNREVANVEEINKNITNELIEDVAEKKDVEEVKLKELPKPEITGGSRGELGIDKNINEETIDQYLGREDAVYRDMRMLEDPGNYESIGGDRFLSGYVKGFEVIPLPYIIPVKGLPSAVGETYTGTTLFYDDNGIYKANYKESMEIIEKVFPKDKVIFLMCGGGGYAGMTKNFLVSLGWDENKIYNTGGYWYYKGEHSITVKKEIDGKVTYDFDSVPYCNITFDKLTKTDDYKAPDVKVTELKINTSKIEIEEGTSFQLNVIVLPNEATNKEVKWTSSDKKVATITEKGLVEAVGKGTATITAESVDENKTVSCKVTVNKKEVSTRIELDDISKVAKEFNSKNPEDIREEFNNTVDNKDGSTKKKYLDSDGSVNDLWRKLYDENTKKVEKAIKERVKSLNKLLTDKKSFIILVYQKDCEGRDYSVIEGAEKILKKNNIPYLYTGTNPSNGDNTIEQSKIWKKYDGGSVVIIKDGKIYATVDADRDSIKSDKETKNWLSKYIDIK